jgi:putative GTP pyrophosphokinase
LIRRRMTKDQSIEEALKAFDEKKHELCIFLSGVQQWFSSHPTLAEPGFPVVHSVKARLKNREHLREKLSRKWDDEAPINRGTIFERVTDLAGVRVLHLYQDQFPQIHSELMNKVNVLKDWHLPEAPKAYTWDPESKLFFEKLGVMVHIKESFYTSVHYLIKPRADSPVCCEIQVRTLFEEIWGEVDHGLNYPVPSEILSCREQLRVLAKMVGAGSRLVDSIFRSARDTQIESIKLG